GEELDSYIAGEPIHPVLLDLCTGVAGASLIGAQEGSNQESSLFLPLKYESVVLRESAPRRFFCRAKWREGRGDDSETQAFDLDFLSLEGRSLGGVRNFIVKRAPRQALLRGLRADSGRLIYRVSWRELPVPSPPQGIENRPGCWLVIGFAADSIG